MPGGSTGYNGIVETRRIITIGVALAVLVLCAGCGSTEGALKSRAAAYYNYMVGLAPGTNYSSFFSPAYRKTFTKQVLKKLNTRPGTKPEANKRYKPASARHIAVVINGRFAYTNIGMELGQSFASVGPARWVRVGSGWYLYSFSTAEKKAYGDFPNSLSPPAPPVAAAK
jgi:hypothetical protein